MLVSLIRRFDVEERKARFTHSRIGLVSSSGFSLVELLVVIAVIVILIALLLPAIGMMRANARQRQCASNQRQIFAAWSRATSRVPVRGAQWTQRISSYIEGDAAVLSCPDDTPSSAASGYALNDRAWRFVAQDAGRIVLLDYKQVEISVVGKSVAQLTSDWPAQQAPRHLGKQNTTFYDGHVDSYEPRKIDPRFCDYYVRYWRPVAESTINLSGCTNSGDPLPTPPVGGTTTGGTTTGGSSTTGGTTGGGCTGVTQILDETAATFVDTWSNNAAGYNGNFKYHAGSGSGSKTATWSFTGLPPGQYQVSATWANFSIGATNAPYVITGDSALPAVRVNQVNPPAADVVVGSANFQNLATVTITGATITVRLTDDANNYVFADAVRITCLGSGTTSGGTSTGGTTTGSQPPYDPCVVPPDAAPGTGADRGINWLVRHQATDGSWSFGFSSVPGCTCPNSSGNGSRNAATALALLPLMGAGSTHGTGPYRDNVCRGLQYLIAAQQPTGDLTGPLAQTDHNAIYTHLMATLVLAEAVRLDNAIAQAGGCPGSGTTTGGTTTGGSGPCLDATQLRMAAQKAIDYAIFLQITAASGRQAPGSWRYIDGGNTGDVSHHIWGVTALLNGKAAGLNVPQSALTDAQSAVVAFQKAPLVTDNGVTLGDYGYNPNQSTLYQPNGTVEGLLCAVLLGAPTSHSRLQSWAANPAYSSPAAVYYNFHATHLLHLIGGQSWSTWNTTIQQGLQQTQASGGHVDGSWYSGNDEIWNSQAGRHYTTCLSMLSLEQNFTHLRLGQ